MGKIQSKIDKRKKECYSSVQEMTRCKNQRRKWRKRAAILIYRDQNIKKDMHWKLSREIIQENKHILISRFQVSDMVRRMSRNISSETARKMLNWSTLNSDKG
jgi:transposase